MAILEAITKYGAVRGIPGDRGGDYSVFRGVPYAAPPVGARRFAPPAEPEAWSGVRDCSAFSAAPYQKRKDGGDYPVSEDCLYLNVYTPARSGGEALPVMFWIYGGVFQFGYGHEPTYDGAALCAEGCILVTINYRVNIFGFFNTPELEARNGGAYNFGILDQIAALRWVQENIAAFGGDPSRVMIFGQSAGGVSTRIQLACPLSRGLFSRAAAHSGGGLNEADLVRPKAEFTKLCTDALAYLGWTTDDALRAEPGELLDKMTAAVEATIPERDLAYFQPFIDGSTVVDVPGVQLWRGEYPQDVAVLCGSVAGDSWMFTRKVRAELGENTAYFRAFAYSPGVAWARHNAEHGFAPIRAYYMDRPQPPKEHAYWSHGAPPFGSETPHAAELPYIFGTMTDPRFTDYDYALAKLLRAYWTNFAKTGDPNGPGLPAWPLFTEETPLAMHFGPTESRAEDLIASPDEAEVIAFCEEQPGMTTRFK